MINKRVALVLNKYSYDLLIMNIDYKSTIQHYMRQMDLMVGPFIILGYTEAN